MHTAQKSILEKIVGQVSVLVLIFLAIVLVFTAILFSSVTNFIRFGSTSTLKEQANSLAEAGVENALYQLNQTAGAFTGDTSPVLLSQDGSFQSQITSKASNLKTITSAGFVGDPANPRSKRTVVVDVYIDSQIVSFNYAVQVGTGGVKMNNSAKIIGTVYSNQTGVSINGSGTTTIEGDAFAVGTITSPAPLVTGTKYQNQPESQFPQIDYDYWKDKADDGGTINCASTPDLCDIKTNTSIGPKKYIGKLIISNGAKVTMDGPLYITEEFNIKNDNSELKLNDSFGSNGTVLITDGFVIVENGAAVLPTSSTPKGYVLVVSTSTDQDQAINIKNAGNNALFYALEGGALIENDDASVTALVAKRLLIKNNAVLTYDLGLADPRFTEGPGGSWQIKKGTYRYTE